MSACAKWRNSKGKTSLHITCSARNFFSVCAQISLWVQHFCLGWRTQHMPSGFFKCLCLRPWSVMHNSLTNEQNETKTKKVNVSLRRSCFAKRTKLQMLFQHKNIHIHTHPSEGELKTFLQQCKSKILKSYAAATKWIRAFWSFNYYTLWSKVSVGSGMSSTRNKIETHKNFFDSSTRELDANQAHQVLQSFRTGAAI